MGRIAADNSRGRNRSTQLSPHERWPKNTAGQSVESITILGKRAWIVTRVTCETAGVGWQRAATLQTGTDSGVQEPSCRGFPVGSSFAQGTCNSYTAGIMAIARDNSSGRSGNNDRFTESSPERLVSASRAEEEQGFELKLRPRWLKEFIGQSKAKEQLAIALEAAKSRGEALDHVLLFGPPGLGKTTLATIIANELDVGFQQTSGPALQIQGDLTAILTNLRERQVLFLDEIHRMQPVLEEKLYTALEDYKLDIIIGQGPAARTHVMEIRPFTFIGATTRPGLLSSPLRSRFGILLRLEFYTEDELRVIVERSAEVMGVPIDPDGAAEIALRSRGTPRIANRLLRRVRDFAQVRGTGSIDRPTANAALTLLEVDAHGFDEIDRRLMLTIMQKYDGGPVGLGTLAATLAEEEDALEEVYEPFLIQIGFLDRTPRGRVATRLAYEHFGVDMPRRQPGLF